MLPCRWLGVSKVILTENSSERPIKSDLKDFIDDGFVDYRFVDLPHAQLNIYQECIDTDAHKYNWIGFIDLDEYLLIREPCAPCCPPAPPDAEPQLSAVDKYPNSALQMRWELPRP